MQNYKVEIHYDDFQLQLYQQQSSTIYNLMNKLRQESIIDGSLDLSNFQMKNGKDKILKLGDSVKELVIDDKKNSCSFFVKKNGDKKVQQEKKEDDIVMSMSQSISLQDVIQASRLIQISRTLIGHAKRGEVLKINQYFKQKRNIIPKDIFVFLEELVDLASENKAQTFIQIIADKICMGQAQTIGEHELKQFQSPLRQSISQLLMVIIQKDQQSDKYEKDAMFYKSSIEDLIANGDLSIEDIDPKGEIDQIKKSKVMNLASEFQKSKILFQSQIVEQKDHKDQNKFKDLKKNMEKITMEKQKMEKEITIVNNQIKNAESKKIKYQLEINQLKKKFLDKQKKIQQYEDLHVQKQKQLYIIREQLQTQKSENLSIKQLHDQKMKEKQKKHQKSINSQVNEIKKLKLEIETYEKQKKSTQEKIEGVLAKLKQKQILIDQLSKYKQEKQSKNLNTFYQRNFKRQINDLEIKKKSVLEFLGQQKEIVNRFQEMLSSHLKRQIREYVKIFQYKNKSGNFIKKIKDRQNIMFICKTHQDRILGGFLSSTSKGQQKVLPAFLFVIREIKKEEKMKEQYKKEQKKNQIQICPLRLGQPSFHHDDDYLVLGNDELSIGVNSNILQSLSSKFVPQFLSYQYKDRQNFLSQNNEAKTARIKNYFLLQVILDRRNQKK